MTCSVWLGLAPQTSQDPATRRTPAARLYGPRHPCCATPWPAQPLRQPHQHHGPLQSSSPPPVPSPTPGVAAAACTTARTMACHITSPTLPHTARTMPAQIFIVFLHHTQLGLWLGLCSNCRRSGYVRGRLKNFRGRGGQVIWVHGGGCLKCW